MISPFLSVGNIMKPGEYWNNLKPFEISVIKRPVEPESNTELFSRLIPMSLS